MSHGDLYERIISKENLFAAWREFQIGKTGKYDVLVFADRFEEHLLSLHADLASGRYAHGPYERFIIQDPKQRSIAKASVRDRILHHAICRVIGPDFDRSFVFDAYSSRKTKGVHKAIDRLQTLARKLSRNHTRTVWALKCDIRKFFDSVFHDRLMELCARRIPDPRALSLIRNILRSFEKSPGRGIPLGNLTSQLFANVYLNELDQFVKHELRIKNYLRYTDDFLLLSADREELEEALSRIRGFVEERLLLQLHPGKVIFRKWHQGIDFLGYVNFPHHRVVRTKTKKRMLRKLREQQKRLQAGDIDREKMQQSVNSYVSVLSHARNRGLTRQLRRDFGWKDHE